MISLNHADWKSTRKWLEPCARSNEPNRHFKNIPSSQAAAAECILFSSVHISFSRTHHKIKKQGLAKLKAEIISSIFSDRHCLKLEIKTMRKIRKPTNMWKTTNIFRNTYSQGEAKEKQKILWIKWKWRHSVPKLMTCWKSNSERETCDGELLCWKRERYQVINPTLQLKKLEVNRPSWKSIEGRK